jgi:hypothetical protein
MERGGVSAAYQQGFVVDKPSDNPNIYERAAGFTL